MTIMPQVAVPLQSQTAQSQLNMFRGGFFLKNSLFQKKLQRWTFLVVHQKLVPKRNIEKKSIRYPLFQKIEKNPHGDKKIQMGTFGHFGFIQFCSLG